MGRFYKPKPSMQLTKRRGENPSKFESNETELENGESDLVELETGLVYRNCFWFVSRYEIVKWI